MHFNQHSDLAGHHAFLSASKYAWLNYDDDKMADKFHNAMTAQRGTELHDIARRLIEMGIKLPKTSKTLNMYVNDAIGFRMSPEQVLMYSRNAFGTCDAISFRKNLLRIADLKNGVIPGSVHQLEIYTAFFCLEYGFKPADIQVELRIYQNDEIQIWEPEVDDLTHIMDRVVTFDKMIDQWRAEALA